MTKEPPGIDPEDPRAELRQSPFQGTFMNLKEASEAMLAREPSAPKKGEPAPDATLSDPDGKNGVQLSRFKGESPVVLVFGSYT